MPSSDRGLLVGLIIIVGFSVAFGGGGSKYGLANLIAQLAALGVLSFHREAFFRLWTLAPAPLSVLVALSVALPIAYLIPLPPSVWQGMPGRDLVAQSFELVGSQQWTALSVDPVRTLLALSALIVPLAILAIALSASRNALILVGWAIVLLALTNFALGIVQVLSNGETGLLYPENPMPGILFGTFANRNSTGIFLVSALSLAVMLPPPERFESFAMPLRLAVCVFLALAILLTQSRTSLLLAVVPLALFAAQTLGVLRARSRRATHSTSRTALIVFVPIVLLVGALSAMIVVAPGRVSEVAERFSSTTEDARSYIWEDSVYAANRYWPVGSGMGTFDDVFQIDESLENMTVRKAGRAHNDYLEVSIEAGLPGLALIAGWLLIVVWFCWRARQDQHRWIAWSGGAILAVIAAQSITDYPLRNLSMLAVAAYALCLLVRFGPPTKAKPEQEVLP